jgi:hypothetical protein
MSNKWFLIVASITLAPWVLKYIVTRNFSYVV